MKLKTSAETFIGGAILFSVISCVGLAGCHSAESRNASPENGVRPVPTARVEASPADRERLFPGKVRANRRVDLSFAVPGLLDVLNAEEGHNIRKGEIIARLDQRDYRYVLDKVTAEYENAGRELARYENMWKQKVVTEAEYEDAKTRYDVCLAELNIRSKALDDTVLRAPFDGIVVQRHVENREHVNAGQVAVSFQDISTVEVVISVPEGVIARGGISALKSPAVRFDADPARWFPAAVCEQSGNASPVTRTYDVVLSLIPPADLTVFPGMTATASVQLTNNAGQRGESVRIPVEALFRGNDGKAYVWVIDPAGGNPEKREAEAVDLSGEFAHVCSNLRPGERVAVAGLNTLRKEMHVRPLCEGKEGLDG